MLSKRVAMVVTTAVARRTAAAVAWRKVVHLVSSFGRVAKKTRARGVRDATGGRYRRQGSVPSCGAAVSKMNEAEEEQAEEERRGVREQ